MDTDRLKFVSKVSDSNVDLYMNHLAALKVSLEGTHLSRSQRLFHEHIVPCAAPQAVQLAVTAAVAEAAAPPPPEPDARTLQLEEKMVQLTAELKGANDR